jgi:hypothetical protein
MARTPSWPKLVVVAWILALAFGLGRAQSPPAFPPKPPVLKVPSPFDSLGSGLKLSDEDGRISADTLRVRRQRLTLREIIERSIAGEKGKLAGHHDMNYTMTLRVAEYWKKKKEIEEYVFRNYSDIEGHSRVVQLDQREIRYKKEGNEWVLDPEDDPDHVSVEVDTEGYRDFQELPFFLEQTHEFDFELLERFVREDHVIFKIGFRPKSSFKPLPSGTVYVDTSAYRIIHEEFDFEHNPFPLFVKDITHMSRYWEELATGEWVFTKMLFEVQLRNISFGYAPLRVAVVLSRSGFRFDEGFDERLFGEGP